MAIPKKIHYCWFSNERKPEKILKCIESWKVFLPEYDIIEWNSKNFDMNCNEFVIEAFQHKKWAFIADYFRVWVLYNYGGIYLDSDVEVKNNLDNFLNCEMFISFEDRDLLGPHVIGSEKNSQYMLKVMETFEKRRFVREDGSLDMIPLPAIVTAVAVREYGLIPNGKTQKNRDCWFYSYNFFTVDLGDGKCIAEHKYSGSWLDDEIGFYDVLRKKLADGGRWWRIGNMKKTLKKNLIRISPKQERNILIVYDIKQNNQSKKVEMELFSKSIHPSYKIKCVECEDVENSGVIEKLRLLFLLSRSKHILQISSYMLSYSLSPYQNYAVVSDFRCLKYFIDAFNEFE